MNPALEQLNANTRKDQNLNTLRNEAMKNPNLFANLIQNNPQFKQFVEANRGLSPRAIAERYGLSWDKVANFLN